MDQQADAVYFDGESNRKRKVQIRLGPALEIIEDVTIAATWPYGDIRRVDSMSGALRLMCITAPALARLEIHDQTMKQANAASCPALNRAAGASPQTLRIVL